VSTGFTSRILNGIAGDPAVFVINNQSSEGILFDSGDLSQISHKELLKVRVVLISHTHIDHFIGFDRLIRVNIPHHRLIEVVGPAGIVGNVCGKLAAYTWNLLEPNQVIYRVHEVLETGEVRTYEISNSSGFAPKKVLITPSVSDAIDIPLLRKDVRVSACVLDHGVPVCAYSVRVDDFDAISKDALSRENLEPGPWISELLERKRTNTLSDHNDIRGLNLTSRQLASKIIEKRRGQKISYVTDVSFSKGNVSKLLNFLQETTVLICETNYRHEHRLKALEKKHLTTKQAALLAAASGSISLEVFHVSAIYHDDPEGSVAEASEFLMAFRQLSHSDLKNAIIAECEGTP
jgi:ribonuclease Z